MKSHLCDRARSWASARTDGELSELESALLDAHLQRCASCTAFAREAERVAAALRGARLERPASFRLGELRGPRGGRRVIQVAAAALVVVGAGLAAALSGPGGTAVTAVKPVAMVASAESPDWLRELRRPALVEQGRTVPRNRRIPGEAV